MHSRNLFLVSAASLVVGLVSLWSKWNGTAGVNAGFPVSAWAVSLSGSVNGWPALIGVVAIFAALVLFAVALIRLLWEPRKY
ncbi:MAG TPA: hypothetical protein VMU45_03685 [Candidatus Eisenbacteria bacterium]|nr:hypothetical protein [Candidatus Eisenbacteria bacterium]